MVGAYEVCFTGTGWPAAAADTTKYCEGVQGATGTTAVTGPDQGEAKTTLCQDLLKCVHQTNCTGGALVDDQTACYCGAGVDLGTCEAATTPPTGLCASQLAGALEANQFSNSLGFFGNVCQANGAAFFLYDWCDTNCCAQECLGVTPDSVYANEIYCNAAAGSGGTTGTGGTTGSGGSTGHGGTTGSGGAIVAGTGGTTGSGGTIVAGTGGTTGSGGTIVAGTGGTTGTGGTIVAGTGGTTGTGGTIVAGTGGTTGTGGTIVAGTGGTTGTGGTIVGGTGGTTGQGGAPASGGASGVGGSSGGSGGSSGGSTGTSLIQNGQFDSTTAPWGSSLGATLDLSANDSGGNAHSGSLDVILPGASSTSTAEVAAHQCISATAGGTYDVSAKIQTPGVTQTEGIVVLWYYPSADCTGALTSNFSAGSVSNASWEQVMASTQVPPGINSMDVRLTVLKPVGQQSAEALFDDVVVNEE
jgi:hypothetical protein